MVMKQYAIVKDGVVQNTLTASESIAANHPQAASLVECTTSVGVGWLYDGANFSAPPFNLSGFQEGVQNQARSLLRASDWVMLTDSMTAAERLPWTTWRATLRDYVKNPGTITQDTVIPEPPSSLDES